MTGWWDEDFEAIVVSSDGYSHTPTGPISAIEVRDGDELRCWLWFGDDPAADAAGTVGKLHPGTDGGNSGVAWWDRLLAAKARGLAAGDAVLELRGQHVADPRFGVAQHQVQHWPDLRALRDATNPPQPRPDNGGRSTRTPVAPSRDQIDAALIRGDRLPESVAEQVRSLDSALARRPTPEAIVVGMVVTREHLEPLETLTARLVVEPTYLRTRIDSAEARYDGPVVLKLRVPAGVPALWTPASEPAAAGTLLLGRGLHWQASRVVDTGTQVVVFGAVVVGPDVH